MEIQFSLNRILNSKLEIIGEENNINQYFSETNIANQEYQYLDTETINIIYKVDSKENEIIDEILINPHILNEDLIIPDDETVYTFSEDGLYKIVHMILPNLSWLNKYEESGIDNLYSFIYITDCNSFYRYDINSKTLVCVEIEEILEINSTNTNISKDEVYTFSIENLKTCYYNICKLLFNYEKYAQNNEYVYKRDLLLIAINTLDYLLEDGKFFEALHVLEHISNCIEFCSAYNSSKKENTCGCNSKY